MSVYGTPETILTALRYVCRDDDGMIYAPHAEAFTRPYIYLPGHDIHAAGEEIHLVNIYPNTGDIEVLAGNGYTLTGGPLIELIRAALTRP